MRATGSGGTFWIPASAVAILTGIIGATMSEGQGPLPPVISPSDPSDVSPPPGFPIDTFDEFSWQMFLTMVWPADPAARGQPDRSRPLGASGPLVFETFRNNWEVFQPGGAAPPAFDDPAAVTPCTNPVPPGAFMLVGFLPLEEFRLADFGPLAGPLVTRQRTYTRFATGFNRVQYEHILAAQLYLKPDRDHPGPARFPDSSVMVKSAWIEMTGVAEPHRYHVRTAWVRDPGNGSCSERSVGLVGLHIVKKTPSRPQWIWSTFEHVDTVPDDGPVRPLIYNNRDGTPMPKVNPYADPQPAVQPPVNIDRIKPIHENTRETNKRYQQALAAQNSVWSNYRLVMTQWPLSIGDPTKSGGIGNSFPGRPPTDRTAFANTTMEPFEQTPVTSGCMACHNNVGRTTDYVWAITNRAAPRTARALRTGRIAPPGSMDELERVKASVERASRRTRGDR